MLWIASGVTDQYVYFEAEDPFTGVLLTGLSSFTAIRSRNGAADVTFTTPTITEIDATAMPGLYALLLDEDMTIDSGDETQAMVIDITQASMKRARVPITLYRPKITVGNTLSVESDGDLTKVNALDGHTAQTGDSFARLGAPAGASVSADIATRLPTSGYTAPLSAAGTRSAVGLASANLDTQLDALPTTAELAIALGTADDAVLAAIAALEAHGDSAWATATGFSTLTSGDIAPAVWDVAMASHLGAGTTGDAIFQAAINAMAVKATTDNLPDGGALTSLAQASALATLDSIVDDILVDTGTTLPAQIAALSIPTANQNADALLDRANAVETGVTPRGALRLAASVLGGKVSGGGSGTETFRNAAADSKDRVVSTNDSSGNRTAVTLDLT